jgi:hypothetical protein
MWWKNLLSGFWNGLSAWVVLIAHAFGRWKRFPVYDVARSGNWYDFGFLVGASFLFVGGGGRGRRRTAGRHGRVPERVDPGTAG